jgi:hypothetical protein
MRFLKTPFLTQIYADVTRIHADFSNEIICDHLRLTLRFHSGSILSVVEGLICENLRLEEFFESFQYKY